MTATNLELFSQPKPSDPDSKWDRWFATEEGRAIFHDLEEMALGRWQRGQKRISVNALVEIRRSYADHPHIDNSLRSLIARELKRRWPVLRDAVETRKRKGEP